MTAAELPEQKTSRDREVFLMVLSAAIFFVFFQSSMVAPLIPLLADGFHVSRQKIGLLIPAYTIPYALAALVCGAGSDRFGRRGILLIALVGFPGCSLVMACAPTLNALIGLRAVSGILNVGVAVMGLSLVGDLFIERERGRAIGWVFGGIAGGNAFGSTFGALLAPTIGWRGLFVSTALLASVPLLFLPRVWKLLDPSLLRHPEPAANPGYLSLLATSRGRRTYGYILLNAIFHAGVFTWLGVYLKDRYGLSEIGIGLALLGYGVPGFALGPLIGRVVDRYGRRHLIPAGLAIASLAAFILAIKVPLLLAACSITLLSLGFDMTHPLLAGIATMLNPRQRGRAMGLNAFSIFFGFGVGSLIFGWLARHDMTPALLWFAAGQMGLALLAARLFQSEGGGTSHAAVSSAPSAPVAVAATAPS